MLHVPENCQADAQRFLVVGRYGIEVTIVRSIEPNLGSWFTTVALKGGGNRRSRNFKWSSNLLALTVQKVGRFKVRYRHTQVLEPVLSKHGAGTADKTTR